MALERLQKIIARAGLASRRKAEDLITRGRVRVNGKVVDSLGARADAEKDHIKVNGRLLLKRPVSKYYYIAFKPIHVITSLADPQGRKTIIDLLRENNIHMRLFPVGRLDWDADGLLLLTNDGDLANRIMHPRSHLPKTYRVKVKGHPTDRSLERLRKGIRIANVKTLPAKIQRVYEGKSSTAFKTVIVQGRYHQLKLMFERIGHPVMSIRRLSIGPLSLGRLQKGRIRQLTIHELRRLKEELKTHEN
jgi:pseudouridine synthase